MNMNQDSGEAQQQQRTFLRERFLRMLGSVSGLKARVRLYDRTAVQCTLGVCDVDFDKVQVSGLGTPMGTLPHALLRTKDIVSIHVSSLEKPHS